jgi:hypothetical protein
MFCVIIQSEYFSICFEEVKEEIQSGCQLHFIISNYLEVLKSGLLNVFLTIQ